MNWMLAILLLLTGCATHRHVKKHPSPKPPTYSKVASERIPEIIKEIDQLHEKDHL